MKSFLSTTVTTIALASTVSLLGNLPSNAAVLVTNFDTTSRDQGNQLNGSDWEFASFVTPDDGLLRTLETIKLSLSRTGTTGTSSTETIEIDWYSDLPSDGNPTGASSIDFRTSDFVLESGAENEAVFTYEGVNPLTLQPGTRYGFIVKGTGGSPAIWFSQSMTTGTDTYTPASADVTLWRTPNSGANFVSQVSNRIFEVTVSDETTPVPEPSTVIGLFMFGISGLALSRRK